MKIGILTFHAAHNYGSMLLAYALQEALSQEGHEVKIINHRIYAQNMMYANPLKFTHKIFIKDFITKPSLFLRNAGKWKKFEHFSAEHHNLTKLCPTLVDVENVIKEERFDAVITGGDQIWNMQCSDFSLAYFLPFDLPGIKKISYSPSFGGGGCFKKENYKHSINGLLKNYDSLSVREESSSHFLTEQMGREVPSVCDPTILLKPAKYESLAGANPIIKERYVFYYSPFSSTETEKIALEFGKKRKIPVYTSNGLSNQCKGMKRAQNSGPIEFLNLIKYADVVCGNSFHLVVFSILFKKIFYVISNADSRMESILNKLQIHNRFVPKVDSVPNTDESIAWENVKQMVDVWRTYGMTYLQNSLK